jgi:dephospho-CoA kinase
MMAASKPPRIGLTGGIGSGKSTASRRLAKLGAAIVDTDAIARSLTLAGGAAMPAIAQTFGASMVGADGAMDRDAMRQLVFNQPDAKRQLEAIIHPLIGDIARRQAQDAIDAGTRAIVFDVPLLAESSHWRQRVDRILVIDCLESTQVERVSQRPGWSVEAARKVVAQQATRAQRRAIADAVIYNDGITIDELEAEIDAVARSWLD